MIASGGFFDAWGLSGTVVTEAYINRTVVLYPVACSTWYDYDPSIEAPNPKRHIPFYRALFDQRFPAPARPVVALLPRQRWSPHMGRVRIDRRPPQTL